MDFLVGTFNRESIYLLHFTPPSATNATATLQLLREHPAIGGHSWLSLSKNKQHLYTTLWSSDGKPAIASYRIKASGRDIQFLNAKHVPNLSGYVCSNDTHVFSAGGASGDVFQIEADGSLGACVQQLDFVTTTTTTTTTTSTQGATDGSSGVVPPHGNFGGLRHGAHSADLSPDGRSLFVADIGRNCIWAFHVRHARRATLEPPLQLAAQHPAPRAHDGPRHAWPHPAGRVLYSLQEHSSMVDVFAVADDGVTLAHKQAVKIIPPEKDCVHYWADEVRCSTGPDPLTPRYLYASTRGLEASTMGYVAVMKLDENGMLESEQPLDVWETPTSGGLANAIEPAPWRDEFGDTEYLAMTDSQEAWVFILSFDGKNVREVSRANLGKMDDGKAVGAATAVWL